MNEIVQFLIVLCAPFVIGLGEYCIDRAKRKDQRQALRIVFD